ncbi:MAG: hypothetical protein ACO1SX_05355 [Actinomycetota bacterium]
MGETDKRAGTPAAGMNEAEAETLPERGHRDGVHPTGPTAIPPDHVVLGGQNELSEEPVIGSVIADDWGYVPDIDADVEGSETRVLHEDAVI